MIRVLWGVSSEISGRSGRWPSRYRPLRSLPWTGSPATLQKRAGLEDLAQIAYGDRALRLLDLCNGKGDFFVVLRSSRLRVSLLRQFVVRSPPFARADRDVFMFGLLTLIVGRAGRRSTVR